MGNGSQGAPSITEQAALWHARLHAADVTMKERNEFQAWTASNAEHRRAYEAMQNLAGKMDALSGIARQQPQVLSSVLQEQLTQCAELAEKAKGRPKRKFAMAVAASLILAIGLAFAMLPQWQPVEPTLYTTAVGEQRSIMLADGSVVTLNTGSQLSVVMTDTARRLQLVRGEAYFDVAKDPLRPFEVAVNNSLVTAVGTAFNIRQNNSHLEVTVLEGRVQVNSGKPGREQGSPVTKRFLHAGQQIDNSGTTLQVTQLDAKTLNNTVLWREGKFDFDNESVSNVIEKIQPYYSSKIIIGDDAIGDLTIGGVFRTDNVELLLSALESALNIRIVRKPGVIVLLRRTDSAPT
jgi:transmembrane sensor